MTTSGMWERFSVEVDPKDGDAHITFLQVSEKCENTFKFPSKPDEVSIKFESILAIIEAPSPHGKPKRLHKVNAETVQMITRLHLKYLEKNTANE